MGDPEVEENQEVETCSICGVESDDLEDGMCEDCRERESLLHQ